MKLITNEKGGSGLNKVLYISVCFMTMSTAVTSAQNLLSQLYAQLGFLNLGIVCLFIIFIMRAFFSIICPHVMSRYSVRVGVLIGTITQIIRISGGSFMALCHRFQSEEGLCHPSSVIFVNIVCAVIGGIGAAFMWYSQSAYVNECADDQNKGLFNGIFWSINQTAQLWGSALAAFILGRADHLTFYMVITIFAVFSAFMMLFIQDPGNSQQKNKKPVHNEESMKESIQSFLAIFNEKQYYFLFVSLFFSGVAIGSYITFLSAAATEVVDSDDVFVTNQKTGYVFMALAVGTILSGLSTGRIADKHDKIKVYTAIMILNEMALVFTVLACIFKSFSLAVFAGFLWGLGDTAIQTMISTVIGFLFNGDKNLFSAYRSIQAVGIVYAALLSIIVPRSHPLIYYMLIFVTLGVCHYLYKYYLVQFKRRSNSLIYANEKQDLELSRRSLTASLL